MKLCILFAVLALCSCGKLERGKVLSKEHQGGYWTVRPKLSPDGKSTYLSPEYEPDVFYLSVSGVYQGKPLTEVRAVSPDLFYTCRVGDTVNLK